MKAKILISILGALVFCESAYSYTECPRQVKNVWTDLSSAKTVWITFTDGGGAIYKAEGQITDSQMSRFFSMALAAQMAQKKLIVRYPEDNMPCTPNADNRGDVLGVWVSG